MLTRLFIRRNTTTVAIFIFIFCFGIVQAYSPSFLYNTDGSLRQFGLGSKKKTIIPIWLIAIVMAIFSYLFVLYYLSYPKFKF